MKYKQEVSLGQKVGNLLIGNDFLEISCLRHLFQNCYDYVVEVRVLGIPEVS